MYVFNRFLGSLINKISWFVLIAIVALICFFAGLWVANAETCTSLTLTSNSVRFTTTTPSDISEFYSHDKIRDVIPTLLNNNENFVSFYGTYTLYNFYQRFNYAVLQQDGEYFRVYYQDINFLNSVSCTTKINKFYIGSFYSTGNYNYNLNFPYSFYIDIHFNLDDNSIIIDNISTLSDNLNALSIRNKKFSSTPGWSSWSFNIPLIDSYNGLQLLNDIESVAFETYIESLNSYFDNIFPDIRVINSSTNNINEIPLAFSGSEVTEDTEEPDPENPGGVDYSGVLGEIKDQLGKQEQAIQESNSILEDIFDSIGSNFTAFREEVAGGFNDIINQTKENTNNLISFFSEEFDSDEMFDDFFDNWIENDEGGLSRIIKKPLILINELLSGSSCSPLSFSIFDKDISVFSGCTLWNKVPESTIGIYNVFVCGLGSYFVILDLFKIVENLKNPSSSEVNTLDL